MKDSTRNKLGPEPNLSDLQFRLGPDCENFEGQILSRLDFIQKKTGWDWWNPVIPGMNSSKRCLYEESLTETWGRWARIGNGKKDYVWIRLWRKTWGDVETEESGRCQIIIRVSTQLTRRMELPQGGLERSRGAITIIMPCGMAFRYANNLNWGFWRFYALDNISEWWEKIFFLPCTSMCIFHLKIIRESVRMA